MITFQRMIVPMFFTCYDFVQDNVHVLKKATWKLQTPNMLSRKSKKGLLSLKVTGIVTLKTLR